MDMELTQNFLRGKNPCAMGYRWFVRNNLAGGDYQAAMDTQVAAGRVEDARWLLENFGSTNSVLELEHLEADNFVYAGTLIVHGDVRVPGQLLVGRSLQAGGGIRAGKLEAGEEIQCGGAIFAAWPQLYAVSFSGFYLAMFAVLVPLILRPVAFKFRSKRESAAWRNGWDWVLCITGLVPSLLFGVAVGNVLLGVPFRLGDDMRIYYDGTFFQLLTPFALLCGLVSLSMLLMHGAAWLVFKTEGEVSARAARYGTLFAVLTTVLFAAFIAVFKHDLKGLLAYSTVSHLGLITLLIVLGTSSSESVLPRMLVKMEALGCKKSVVGLVIPTGYSFNLDGTSIYLTMAAVFIAQATNTPLDLFQQFTLLVVLLISSKGAAGVTGSGFIVLAATISAVGHLPLAGLALILGIDRFMSEARALTNLIGNGVATLVVARYCDQLDEQKMNEVLANPVAVQKVDQHG